jgi:hypothetical protein
VRGTGRVCDAARGPARKGGAYMYCVDSRAFCGAGAFAGFHEVGCNDHASSLAAEIPRQ